VAARGAGAAAGDAGDWVYRPQVARLISERLRAFHQGLKETGYIEGENVAIVYRFAENQNNRLPELAADLVRRQVAVIATAGDDVPSVVKAATMTVRVGSNSAVSRFLRHGCFTPETGHWLARLARPKSANF